MSLRLALWGIAAMISAPLSGAISPMSASGSPITISGAGSTFDANFFSVAFAAYSKHHPVNVAYQAVGSGSGITLGQNCQVDFWASDVPMIQSEMAADKCGKVVQAPVTLGGAAIIYNLKHVKELHLRCPVLADIYLGKITSWRDPRIRRLNRGKTLPNERINVIHRLDSSGTSYIFTDYLSHESSTWKTQVGAAKTPAWPTGTGVLQSGGVADVVKSTPGAIGYVEVSYVLQNKLQAALVENRAHKFTSARLRGVAADAAQFTHISSTKFSIVDGPGAASYPISGYSWVILYRHQKNRPKTKALVALLKWLMTSGQSYGRRLDYVALPGAVRTLALRSFRTVHT
jgi:phosphate transport system substrate-binding protein